MATIVDTGTTSDPHYTKVAIWLHWAIGLAVIANIALAMLAEGLPRDVHRAAMDVHKALGITILLLTLLRLFWRLPGQRTVRPGVPGRCHSRRAGAVRDGWRCRPVLCCCLPAWGRGGNSDRRWGGCWVLDSG